MVKNFEQLQKGLTLTKLFISNNQINGIAADKIAAVVASNSDLSSNNLQVVKWYLDNNKRSQI